MTEENSIWWDPRTIGRLCCNGSSPQNRPLDSRSQAPAWERMTLGSLPPAGCIGSLRHGSPVGYSYRPPTPGREEPERVGSQAEPGNQIAGP
jgi:hypothetical protein